MSKEIISIGEEFRGIHLGDIRLNERLKEIANALSQNPAGGLPGALGNEAALKGAYRFFNHEDIQSAEILEIHAKRTRERIKQTQGDVVVAHDTTSFSFGGKSPREGLARLRKQGGERGFFGHLSCAFSVEEKEPLGTLASEFFTRKGEKKGKRNHSARLADPDLESKRWGKAIVLVDAKSQQERQRLVHVMDREADSYELILALYEEKIRFVTRLCHDRSIVMPEGILGKVSHGMEGSPFFVEREVVLSARKRSDSPKTRKIHPERTSRVARLELRAKTLLLKKPDYYPKTMKKSVEVNVVDVTEVDPPAGETAVHWRLYTKEPITNAAQVERVVDLYRMRWGIEEYFKALKTGCAYEKLQLESLDALLIALSIVIPISWNLLRLRFLERAHPEQPATQVLSSLQILVLQSLVKGIFSKKALEAITTKEAFVAIAGLGGHLKQNGSPGWLTLTRGWLKLHHAVTAILTFASGKNCVQS